jgi:hypothetical protein
MATIAPLPAVAVPAAFSVWCEAAVRILCCSAPMLLVAAVLPVEPEDPVRTQEPPSVSASIVGTPVLLDWNVRPSTKSFTCGVVPVVAAEAGVVVVE